MQPEPHPICRPIALSLLCAALLAGCASLPGIGAPQDAREQQSETDSGVSSAQEMLQDAIRVAGPRQSSLRRARSLLEGLLAAEDPESRAQQPCARALLEQINERQRLAGLNERLSQQLRRSEDSLKDSEQRNEALQRKLDALAEIERSLAPRSPAPVLPHAPAR